jgi:hypothetical protein
VKCVFLTFVTQRVRSAIAHGMRCSQQPRKTHLVDPAGKGFYSISDAGYQALRDAEARFGESNQAGIVPPCGRASAGVDTCNRGGPVGCFA